MAAQKIILAADHAGFELKEKVKSFLEKNIYRIEDLSPTLVENDDYPDVAFRAAKKVALEKALGVFCCGSGHGMCICANKVKKIRATLCHDENSARRARQENDANVLCLGSRINDDSKNLKVLKVWLTNNFLEGRHRRRVDKISQEYDV